jgi:hypothetical protein
LCELDLRGDLHGVGSLLPLNHFVISLLEYPARPRADGRRPCILKVLLQLHGRLHSWDDLRLVHHVNHLNLLRLGFEVRADRRLKETCGVLLLRGDIECLEKRIKIMNQIHILIVLIGLAYYLVNFFQDIQVGFDPRILVFEDCALLAFL